MFKFNATSGWSFELELECFVIYKKLESVGFARGKQTELCKRLAERCSLDEGTLKAKVGNYKSEHGHTNNTNSSKATRYISEQFKDFTLAEAKALLAGYKLGIETDA